jgi:hypothetical protein
MDDVCYLQTMSTYKGTYRFSSGYTYARNEVDIGSMLKLFTRVAVQTCEYTHPTDELPEFISVS